MELDLGWLDGFWNLNLALLDALLDTLFRLNLKRPQRYFEIKPACFFSVSDHFWAIKLMWNWASGAPALDSWMHHAPASPPSWVLVATPRTSALSWRDRLSKDLFKHGWMSQNHGFCSWFFYRYLEDLRGVCDDCDGTMKSINYKQTHTMQKTSEMVPRKRQSLVVAMGGFSLDIIGYFM